jgi:hypothetical protein
MRWLVAHQGWYFFPILLLEGISLHKDGISRIISRDKIQRRWVQISLHTLRSEDWRYWCSSSCPRRKR